MQLLARRQSWQQQLRQTKAKERLLNAQPDQFPLADVQKIAESILRHKSPSFRRHGIKPQSTECDILFVTEFASLKGELALHESAIVACLHLLSFDQARGQIFSLRPDPEHQDVFFEQKLSTYLQCIVLSRRAKLEVCTEDEGCAAKELLGVLHGNAKDFPSILRVLEVVGRETCETLLPLAMVQKVLKTSHYQHNLARELETLRRDHRWFNAYKLVYGLRKVIGLPRADQMLREMIPDFPMWTAWRPDFKRIASWESPLLVPFRSSLGPLFELEGPDTMGQQRGTLRMSSPGAFSGLTPVDGQLLDRLLDALDRSLAIGTGTVDFLIALCVEESLLSEKALQRLEAAIMLGDDTASKTLAANVRRARLAETEPAGATITASAGPLPTQHPHVQGAFNIFVADDIECIAIG